MKRRVTMFMSPFAELVEHGIKKQTVRPLPKLMPAEGDILDARKWTGKPYRSPTQKLIESPIIKVEIIGIDSRGIIINWQRLTHAQADDFARLDGFSCFGELNIWFARQYPKVCIFSGIVIHWK